MTDEEFIAMLWAHPELWPKFKQLVNELASKHTNTPTSDAKTA